MKSIYLTMLEYAATDRQREYVDAYFANQENVTAAAKQLGIDRRAVGRAIKQIKERAAEAGNNIERAYTPKIMFIDIETSPLIMNGWSMYDKFTPGGYKGVLQDTGVICYARKYQGDKHAQVYSLGTMSEEQLAAQLWVDMNEADWFVAHNGNRFDLKRINTMFLKHGMRPYRPLKTIDTLRILKSRFSFTSNRLDDICQVLFGIGKIDTGGIELWQRCLQGDKEAYKEMELYNVRDIELLEALYHAIKGWATNHPNYNIFSSWNGKLACTTCGSENLTHDGTVRTAVSEFEALQCDDCGAWSRGRRNIRETEEMKDVLTHAK